MSEAYDPSRNATAGDPWETAFLSERDLSSQVPINYVPHAGIYLTPACFSNGVYEDDAAQLCISNLIASQIRRFIIDVYWDPSARAFGLCPVQVPTTMPEQIDTASTSATTRRSISTGDLASTQELRLRQAVSETDSSSSPSSTSSLATTVTTTTATIGPVTSTTSDSGTVLYQLGQYRCSASLDIDKVLAVFQGYYEQSANTIDARLQYLIFNLQVARPYGSSDQENDSLEPNELPGPDDNFGSHFDKLVEYLYAPSQLDEERLNLNASWYRQADAELLPLNQYFSIQALPNGDLTSPNGWPNENYIQFVHSRRVLLGYGRIGDDIQSYDIQQDSSIFAPGMLGVDRSATLNDTGGIESGCFYNASQSEVLELNSSWAFTNLIATDSVTLGNAADNLTTCGISPVLNATLLDSPGNENPAPYQSFGNQALFSWAVGQPTNPTDNGNSLDSPLYRCAIIASNSDYRGHWKVEDCQAANYVACRVGNEPYQWLVSSDKASYARASSACGGNSSFDVPRTGLENNYLHQRILQDAVQRDDATMIDATWINFNSLDVETCWVTTGFNGTCPYRPDDDAIRQRQILVPAIAAFIVILLTVLTILVKCSANRRNSKIRKRGEGGWDYEGVPS